jgi:hypothetical protein
MSGIESLKKLVKELVEFGKTAEIQLKDGFQWTDILPLFLEGKDLTFVVSNWGTIKEEVKDLDVEESKALVLSLVEELGVSDEEVKDLIEKAITFAESGYDLFKSIQALKN